MNEQALFTTFLKAEKQNRSVQGFIGLQQRVPKLFTFLKENDLQFGEVRFKQALAYQGWLLAQKTIRQGKPYSSRTVLSYLAAAGSFYDFLKTKGVVQTNPFREIRKVRAAKKLPKNILKEKQMSHFLDRLARFEQGKTLKHRIFGYRLHVIAELMYSTGLRIMEVAQLKPEDLDFNKGLVQVSEGKGGLSRTAYLNDYAKEVLRLYLEQFRPLLFSEWNWKNGHLLFGVGWRWFEHQVNNSLNRAAEEAGLPRFTSHHFRHALGYHLHRAGCNIRHIQSILGHKRLRNTEIYVAVDKETLKEALDCCHPRGRLKRCKR